MRRNSTSSVFIFGTEMPTPCDPSCRSERASGLRGSTPRAGLGQVAREPLLAAAVAGGLGVAEHLYRGVGVLPGQAASQVRGQGRREEGGRDEQHGGGTWPMRHRGSTRRPVGGALRLWDGVGRTPLRNASAELSDHFLENGLQKSGAMGFGQQTSALARNAVVWPCDSSTKSVLRFKHEFAPIGKKR